MTNKQLAEASNLTTQEKMELWANGQRRENIGAAGEPKLDNFARVSIYMAEHTKDTALAQRLLNNNVRALCNEFRKRGLISAAQKYEAEYTRVSNLISGTASKHQQDVASFAKTAFSAIIKKCDTMTADLDVIKSTSQKFFGATDTPKNLVFNSPISVNLLEIFDKGSGLTTFEGSSNYLNEQIFGKDVVDAGTINLHGNVGVNDFAERLFYNLHNISVLGLQAFMVARKIAKLHPDKVVAFRVYRSFTNLLLPHFQININYPNATTKSIAVAYPLEEAMKVNYQNIRDRDVVISVSINGVINNYSFDDFASVCKKFISEL